MPTFGKRSLRALATCDDRIQQVFNRVIVHFDCTILEGHRGRIRQNEAFDMGRSKVKWPDSRHNTKPSIAVDAAPWPIDWNDRDRFHYFGGLVIGIARELWIPLYWGGDWNGDGQMRDNRFDDLPHFELRDELAVVQEIT